MHECTPECGPVIKVLCWKCVIKIAEVRQAHVKDAQAAHNALVHDGKVRPTQKPGEA